MYIQDFLQQHTSGQGGVGPNDACGDQLSHDKMTPHTPCIAPLFSTEQSETHSATPPRPAKSASVADQRTPDRAEEGVDAEPDSNDDVEAAFPGYSHVTSTSSIETSFLVKKELVPIELEKIPGNYTLFNLVFII